MPDLIVIGGAPGVGKSTLADHLVMRLQSPRIDFGRLREFHLDREWRKANADEEAMSFENLTFVLRNYLRRGYSNVIVDDLQDHRIQQMPTLFANVELRIITLFTSDAAMLRQRIRERAQGWRDDEAAVAWNQSIIDRSVVNGECKIDAAGKSAMGVAEEAIHCLESR